MRARHQHESQNLDGYASQQKSTSRTGRRKQRDGGQNQYPACE
jgi:hypothetical protein